MSRLVLHGLGEQRVIAIPLCSVIEWNQEQVSTFQLFEHVLTVVSASDRVTERTRQAVEKNRLQQELLQRFRLGREHIGNKILQDVPVTASKGHEHVLEITWIVSPLQGESQQAQPGHPALCASFDARDRLTRERERE